MNFDELKSLLTAQPVENRKKLFDHLRIEFPIHKLEEEFNASAEAILEAIARSPDLTKRGIRGLLAESAFIQDVLPAVAKFGWKDVTPPVVASENAASYDALVERDEVKVRIQIKTQRRRSGKAWLQTFEQPWGECYVVETQRTRGGQNKKTGARTRPYSYSEFDVLAVCMWASTGEWTRFRYALSKDLRPEKSGSQFLSRYQPVPVHPTTSFWSANLHEILDAFVARRGEPPSKPAQTTLF